MLKKIALFFLCAFVCTQVFASGGAISEFKINGLKRTREFIIQNDLKAFKGQPATEENLKKIDDLLHLENLFSEIAVSYSDRSDGNKDVNITVKEKMYLLAAPVGGYSGDDGWMGGLYVVDTNAFGIKDAIVAGAMFSRYSQALSGAYRHRPKGYIPGFGISADFDRNTRKRYRNKDGDIISKSSHKIGGVSLAVTEQLTDFLSVEGNAGIKFMDVDMDWGMYVDDSTRYSLGASVALEKNSWNGCFTINRSLSVSQKSYFVSGGHNSQAIYANLVFEYPLCECVKLSYRASGFCGQDMYLSEMVGNSAGSVKLYESEFVTSRIFGNTLEIEAAILRMKLGMLSVYGDYQFAVAEDFDEDDEFVQGVGGGIKIYIAQIAVPAIGIGGLWNITDRRFIFNLSLGMSF